ncbi:hypothetical protein V1264_019615 [Littorina saxatilis]
MMVCSPDVAWGYDLFCSPKLWEGHTWTLHITHADQAPQVRETTARVSVDVIGQRYATQETGHNNGQPFSVFYLYYYAANTLYKVEDGRCETFSPLHGNLTQKCVEMPDSHASEYLKEYMGGYNSGVWANGVRGKKDGVGYFYSVAPEGSMPLMEETQGEVNKVPAYTLTNYYNITLGITDPAVFTPPQGCI